MSGPQNRGILVAYEEGERDAGWESLQLAALCIGVGAYSGPPRLENPVRDVDALFKAINKFPNCRARATVCSMIRMSSSFQHRRNLMTR